MALLSHNFALTRLRPNRFNAAAVFSGDFGRGRRSSGDSWRGRPKQIWRGGWAGLSEEKLKRAAFLQGMILTKRHGQHIRRGGWSSQGRDLKRRGFQEYRG